MSSLIIFVAVLFIIVGFVGSIVPGLPGSPMYLVAMLMARYYAGAPIGTSELIVYALLVVFTFVADFVVPMLTTKFFGGSKAGMWGSVFGLFAGIFIPLPTFGFGVIIWPFAGAVLGERLFAKKEWSDSFKSGLGNLIGFIVTTLFKIALGFWVLYRLFATLSQDGIVKVIIDWIGGIFFNAPQ